MRLLLSEVVVVDVWLSSLVVVVVWLESSPLHQRQYSLHHYYFHFLLLLQWPPSIVGQCPW